MRLIVVYRDAEDKVVHVNYVDLPRRRMADNYMRIFAMLHHADQSADIRRVTKTIEVYSCTVTLDNLI